MLNEYSPKLAWYTPSLEIPFEAKTKLFISCLFNNVNLALFVMHFIVCSEWTLFRQNCQTVRAEVKKQAGNQQQRYGSMSLLLHEINQENHIIPTDQIGVWCVFLFPEIFFQ